MQAMQHPAVRARVKPKELSADLYPCTEKGACTPRSADGFLLLTYLWLMAIEIVRSPYRFISSASSTARGLGRLHPCWKSRQ